MSLASPARAQPDGVTGYLGVRWFQPLETVLATVPGSVKVGHPLLGYQVELAQHTAWGRPYHIVFSIGPGAEIEREGLIGVTLHAADEPVAGPAACLALCQEVADRVAGDYGRLPPVVDRGTDPQGFFTSYATQRVYRDGSGTAVTGSYSHGEGLCAHAITFSPERVFKTMPTGGPE